MSATHSYAAFGLDVASALDLPELAPTNPPGRTDEQAADVVIERGPVEPPSVGTNSSDDATAAAGPLRRGSADELYLTYPVADLRIRAGREITVDPTPGAPPAIVRAVVVGPAFNHLLHQRGYYVLHASTVSIDGDAVAFVGRSGDGKSTTASTFLRRGHRVLSDDVAAVRRVDDVPVVTPGHPTVKLDPAAATALSIPVVPSVRLADRDRHFFRLPDGVSGSPAPLERIYLLEDGPTTEVEPVPSGEGVVELVRHTYTAGLLADRAEATSNFERCARLVGDVEVKRLRRRRTFEELPAVVDAVEADLGVDA